MSRTAKKAQEPVTDVVLKDSAVAAIEQAQDTLAVEDQQMQAHVRAVALQVGYQLPGDCIDPDLIQRDIAANMRRSVEACLEVGRGLSALKAACQHGSFMARLDVLGIEPRVAQRFMQSAVKFSNAALTTHLTKAIGNQTKLFEMLVLDDEQIDELALTGETGELKLDEIATMSVKELRSALRQAKEDNKFIAERRDKEQQRADQAEKQLRSGGPKARSLEERVADFSGTVNLQQDAAMDALLVMDQQIRALDTWYMEYAANQPGYEPGNRVEMPVEVLALVQKLQGNVDRIAATVGGLQHLVWSTFGHELEAVTVHQMEAPATAEAE